MDSVAPTSPTVPTEVELKLLVASEHLRTIRDLPWLGEACQGRPVRQHLISTYFDSLDETLLRRGVALRVRRCGRRRVQTLKADQRDTAGLFRRLEWESPVSGNVPDLAAIRTAGLGDLVEGLAHPDGDSGGNPDSAPGSAVLRPICGTDIHRTEMTLAGDGWVVALALDEGTVSAGGRKEKISEIELELVEGTPAAVYALAARLAAVVPLRLGRISKAERALALARGAPQPRPVRAEAPALSGDMPVGAAFQAIGRACLTQMAANEPALLDIRDPEAVHQMRVSVRRLRSAMTIFGAVVGGPDMEDCKADLRWLMTLLGPARDTDVFLADILDPVIARFPDDQGLVRLRALFTARREAHYDDAAAGIGGARFTRLVLRLGAWIEGGDWLRDPERAGLREVPVIGFARTTLDRRWRKLWKAGRHFNRLVPQDRHNLRILVKKLRYTAEFFAGLFRAPSAGKVLKDLGRLQDQLGALNDVAVAARLLHDTLADHRAAATVADEAERAWGAGLVTGWHQHDAADALEKAARTWARLRRRRPFWNMRGRR